VSCLDYPYTLKPNVNLAQQTSFFEDTGQGQCLVWTASTYSEAE